MLKLERLYKSETALEILQEAILSGDIESGTEITQTEAALSLGVSRMPVREALISLEYCGLLERLPGQHVRVAELDEESIKNIFHDVATLTIEIIKNLDAEELHELFLNENQVEFQRTLREKTKSSLRKKFLEIISEIYLPFILKYSENINEINEAFKKFLENNSAYEAYCETLAFELIEIRKRKRD